MLKKSTRHARTPDRHSRTPDRHARPPDRHSRIRHPSVPSVIPAKAGIHPAPRQIFPNSHPKAHQENLESSEFAQKPRRRTQHATAVAWSNSSFMTGRRTLLQADTNLRVLRMLQDNPDVTQRKMAEHEALQGEIEALKAEAAQTTPISPASTTP